MILLSKHFQMHKAVSYLFFCLLLLAIGGFNSAHAGTLVDSRMSGSWYDPSHSGEGFLLEVLENNTAVIYWFTYDEAGAQRWFISVGEVASSAAVFDELLLASGPEFGDGFDPGDVVYSDIGELRIQWEDCSQATATYTVNGVQGSQSLYRLSTLAGLDCEAPISSFSTLSGSWFDQTHNGEGLVIEALNDGRVLLFWFSYDDEGKQVWFYGLGEQSGADVSISAMFITSGGRFGPNFDPEQVQHELWGSLQLELGCDFGKFDYASGLPVFGSGKQTLTRLTSPGNPDCEASQPPNILLVIADDLGLDASNQYDISPESPVTPSLDQLANQGLVFENTWSNPSCSPTRAGMLTGKFGTRTGVLSPGDVLSENEVSLQSYIHQHLPGKYTDAVIGKWHLGPRPGGEDHPAALGIGYFAGFTGVGVGHYENWSLTINGQTSTETTYVTSKLVDLAIDWTGGQEKPWFLWLAFNAPHQPYHLPPSYLHSRELSGTKSDIAADPLPYYLAAIEAMDTEIGRLLDSFDEQTRVNTIVIFVGDNGTHEEVAQLPYSKGKAKRSLYQGGINVPLLISGPGVKRIGERESALVNTTDLFSTIAALTGVNVDRVNDSISFENLLGEEQEPERLIQYSERSTSSGEEWTLSDGIYKLIESSEGRLQLYELSEDPFENTDLVGAGIAPIDVLEDLQFLAHQIKSNGAPQ